MTELLQNAGMNGFLTTLIVAMLPVLELRGAIPLGISMGLHPWTALLAGVLGNLIPAPFIIIFARRVFAWIRAKSGGLESFVSRLESRAEGQWEKIHRYQVFGLLIFVAIPLPGTGAWSGALIAAVMNMRLRSALPAIAGGVVTAGFIITGLTVGFTAIFI